MGTLEPPPPNMTSNLAADTGGTPPKAKKGVSAHAIHGGLAHARKATMFDLGDVIPEVPLDWFQTNILPPLPPVLAQDSLDLVMKELRRRGAFTGSQESQNSREPPESPESQDQGSRVQKSQVWSKFSTKPSLQTGLDKGEDNVFKSFQGLAFEIGQAAEAVLSSGDAQQLVEFRCNPSMSLMSTLRDNQSRPDSYGVYKKHPSFENRKTSQKVYWELVVAPGEFKKKKDDMNARNDVSTTFSSLLANTQSIFVECHEDHVVAEPYHA